MRSKLDLSERERAEIGRRGVCCALALILAACGGDAEPLGRLRQAVRVEAIIDGIGEGHEVELYARCTPPVEGERFQAACSPQMMGQTSCSFEAPVGSGEVQTCDVEIEEVGQDGATVFREARPPALALDGTDTRVMKVWNLGALGQAVRGVEVCRLDDGPGQLEARPAPSLPAQCEVGAGPCRQGTRCIFDYAMELAVQAVEILPQDWRYFLARLGGSCTGVESCGVALDPQGRRRASVQVMQKPCSPDGWCQDNPLSHGVVLHDIWGSDPGDVYAVGREGTILHSVDRGRTWARPSSGATYWLYTVWGSRPGDVYAAGSGPVLHSSDGGKTWTSPSPQWLDAVWGSGPADLYGFAANHDVLHSSDGARTWTKRYSVFSEHAFWVSSMWGSGSRRVCLVGAFNFMKEVRPAFLCATDDSNWKMILYADIVPPANGSPPPQGSLDGIWGSSPDDFYIVGSVDTVGVILHATASAGKLTWSVQHRGAGHAYRSVWGSNPDDVYVVGSGGEILNSRDRGKTWTAQTSSTQTTLVRVWGIGPDDVYALASDGTILHRGR